MGSSCVAIILVNWNGAAFLRPCLESIRALDFDRDRIETILVDNGSTDDSPEIVRTEFPEVRVLQNDRNNYARANNRGVEEAKDARYVVLLNNDTEVESDWLNALVETLESHPDAAGAGSKILFQDGRINSTGIEAMEDFHWSDRGFGEDDRGQYEDVDEVEGLSGCSVIYRRDVYVDAGGLDEDFEMYYEDVEFSMRLRARGYRLLYSPKSRVIHRYNASISQLDQGGAKDRYGERNRLFIVARYFPDRLPWILATSRFLYDAPMREIRGFIAVLQSKWVESESISSSEADRAKGWILGAKRQILRLQRSSRAANRALDNAVLDKKSAIEAMNAQVEYHKDLLARTEDRLHRELDTAQKTFRQQIEEAEHERDRARAAFDTEQRNREERETWIGFLLDEIQRHRRLQDSESEFLENLRSSHRSEGEL